MNTFIFAMNNNGPRFDINGNRLCDCDSGHASYWLNDGYGIPLCRACIKCESGKLKRYRADINERYESDEPIDSDY